MEIKKVIIFFNKTEHFEKYNLLNMKFYQNDSIKIIACNLVLRIYLKSKGINYDIEENYIKNADPKKMDDIALYITKNWHKNLFLFQDISLGSLDEYDNLYYFSRIIRNVQTILNIIDREIPTEIISFFATEIERPLKEFNDVLEYICSIKNVRFNLIHIDDMFNANLSIEKKTSFQKNILKFLKFIKRFFLENYHILLLNLFLSMKLIVYRKRKNIFIDGFRYNESIIKAILQKHNLFIMASNVNKLGLIQNLRNIFNRKEFGYNIFLESAETVKLKSQTNKYFNILFNKWKLVINNIYFREIFNYNGISIWPIVKRKIYRDIAYNFKALIKTILIQYNYLKKLKINAIVYKNDSIDILKSLAIIATKLKIPSIVIQHGILGGVFYFHGFVPSYSTKFAAWGRISRELLIKNGMDQKKILITGCPRFDKYTRLNKNIEYKKKIRNRVFEDFKLQKDKKLIVLGAVHSNVYHRLNTDLNISYIEKFLEITFNAVKNIPDSYLIVKLHPGDVDGYILYELKKILDVKNISITNSYNILKLIVACDCFISEESTTVIEAALLEKPVICLNFHNYDYTIPYFKYEIVYKATNYEDLINQIQKALNNPIPLKNYEKFFNDYLYKSDGLSTIRVLKLMEALITNKLK